MSALARPHANQYHPKQYCTAQNGPCRKLHCSGVDSPHFQKIDPHSAFFEHDGRDIDAMKTKYSKAFFSYLIVRQNTDKARR